MLLAEDDPLAAAALAAIRSGDVEGLARLLRDEPGASALMLQRRRCTWHALAPLDAARRNGHAELVPWLESVPASATAAP